MNDLLELESWRLATVILTAVAVVVFLGETFIGRFFTPEFDVFIIYIPTVFSICIYLLMRWGRGQRSS